MHYYKFNIKDWTRDTAHLTVEEEGVYRRLLDHYYETETPIPLETHPLIRRLRLAGHEETVGLILDEFFIKCEDGFRNHRCDAEISSYHGKAQANRSNGKKGGRPRKQPENPSGFHKEPTENLNHKPLTTNQEPKDKKTCAQRADHADTFEVFWKMYPKKQAKEPAKKAWAKLKPVGEMLDKIMDALAKQCASNDWTKEGGQFIPQASTWIDQKRWEDEIRRGG